MPNFHKRTITLLCITILSPATLIDGFAPRVAIRTNSRTKTSLHAAARRNASSSPLLDEALSTYPFRFRPDNETSGTKASCSVTFNELARLYGDEEALEMVQLEPRSLKIPMENFALCLDAWSEQFGLEASQAMVGRNPGLLSVLPKQAKEPAEPTMAFSYIVAVTRPLPKIFVVGGILSILTAGMR